MPFPIPFPIPSLCHPARRPNKWPPIPLSHIATPPFRTSSYSFRSPSTKKSSHMLLQKRRNTPHMLHLFHPVTFIHKQVKNGRGKVCSWIDRSKKYMLRLAVSAHRFCKPIIFDTKLTMALAGWSGSSSAKRWLTLSVVLPCLRATNPNNLEGQK